MENPAPKFDFYQQVVIISASPEKTRQIGRVGVVLGRTQTEDRLSWYYTVQIAGDDSWCFFEHELEAAGRFFAKEDFFSGRTVKVRSTKADAGEMIE